MTKKRVIFCTNSSIYSSLILEKLLTSQAIEVVGVYLSDRVRTKSGSFIADIFRIIKTSGITYASYLAMGTLVFDLFRWPGTRQTIKGMVKNQNIATFSNKDINAAESLSWLQGLQPDILFSGFFNQKLGSAALSIPKIAPVNLHPALLPKYKGVDPVFYYFLNKEPTLGISLHHMDIHYDTGEILNSMELEADQQRSVLWHNIELFKLGAELFIRWAEHLNNAESEKQKRETYSSQEQESEFYDSWPSPEQVKASDRSLFTWKDFLDQTRSKY